MSTCWYRLSFAERAAANMALVSVLPLCVPGTVVPEQALADELRELLDAPDTNANLTRIRELVRKLTV